MSANTVANAIAAAWPASQTQGAKTGTSGVYTNSTSAATKINTPIVNIPQSLSVVTKEFIADNAFQNLTDVTRYVPGVDVHQGEGNRDELIIRGVDSSANFFVNGFRDDVQIFRDFYNAQSVEILKGPSAITFGRSSGGGLLNRTLKEADGQRIYEATVQTGSWSDQRYTIDAGQAVSENFAARLNMMYEKSDGFRQYFFMERYGINPTFTYKLDPMTTLKFSYEYFHDDRTADRGNPSQATMPGGSTKQNPGFPFSPNGDLQAFYGSPTLNRRTAQRVHVAAASIDHDWLGDAKLQERTDLMLMVWSLRQHAIDCEVSAAAPLMLQGSALRIEFIEVVEFGRLVPGAHRDLVVIMRDVGETADTNAVVLRRRIVRLQAASDTSRRPSPW